MKTKLYAAPAIEPVTLSEIKEHCRITSNSFADDFTRAQSIPPGPYFKQTVTGTAVDVQGTQALMVADFGTVNALAPVTVKLQELVDNTTWADVVGGALAQVTDATDNAVVELAYTGAQRYVRAVATVGGGEAVVSSYFSVSIEKNAPLNSEDLYLASLITTARKEAEQITGRAFITQTRDVFLHYFPFRSNMILLPGGSLQSVSHVKYKDAEAVETTLTEDTDYLLDTGGDDCPGAIVLPYSGQWPSFTPYPVQAVSIRYICGYGATAASVPENIRHAIKIMVADLYENRETNIIGLQLTTINTVKRLLGQYRLYL